MSDAALFRNCNIMGKVVGKDILLLREMAKDPEQWVPLSFLASYPKLRTMLPSGNQRALMENVAAAVSYAVAFSGRLFGASHKGGDNSAGHDWRTGAG